MKTVISSEKHPMAALDKDRDVSWKKVSWIVGSCFVATIMTLFFVFNKTDIKDLRTEIKDLRTEIKDLRTEMNTRLTTCAPK